MDDVLPQQYRLTTWALVGLVALFDKQSGAQSARAAEQFWAQMRTASEQLMMASLALEADDEGALEEKVYEAQAILDVARAYLRETDYAPDDFLRIVK